MLCGRFPSRIWLSNKVTCYWKLNRQIDGRTVRRIIRCRQGLPYFVRAAFVAHKRVQRILCFKIKPYLMTLRSKLCIVKVEKSGESFTVRRAYPHHCVSFCVEVKKNLKLSVDFTCNSLKDNGPRHHSLRLSRQLHYQIFLLFSNKLSVMEWILTTTVRRSVRLTGNETSWSSAHGFSYWIRTILNVLERFCMSVCGVWQSLWLMYAKRLTSILK